MQTQYFRGLLNDLSQRTTSGVMSWLNVSNLPLRQHLFEVFNKPYGEEGSFIAKPTFEPVFSWRPCNLTMEDLGKDLLSESLIDALDKPYITEEKLKEAEKNKTKPEDYRFAKDIKPYQHQLESWQVLNADTPKSLVVTSGTGSGKTECFMIPILDGLVREYEKNKAPLEGVQALFLYPLNALINSQKDRLLAWTGNFERNIRFCLYNGNTPTEAERGGNKNLSEVADRKTLRASPPPILVTNATMLEYMLVRNDDHPIIAKSKGKLKWIVLDEAHSYVGSQAAELSLLIRRVIHAFEVDPNDIRFIATSATIGDPQGEAGQALRQFLADVGGIDVSQVELRYGLREVPTLAEPKNSASQKLTELENLDNEEVLYEALLKHPTAYKIRKLFTPTNQNISTSTTRSLDINDICSELYGKKEQYSVEEQTKTLEWLDVLATAKNKQQSAYLPLRAHIYHQTMTGIWACADPNCSDKHDHSPKLMDKAWPYGQVYLSPRNHCLCGAPVYELIFCDDCGEVYLNAQENSINISPYQDDKNVDEFELERETDDDENEPSQSHATYTRLLITNRKFEQSNTAIETIDKTTNKYCEVDHANALSIEITPASDFLECPSCTATLNGKQNKIKNGRVGTPYLLGGILPTLLEYAPDVQDDPKNKPYRGRRLLTFNDSRQGTARIATKLQQDAERAKVRSWIYHQVNQISKSTDENPEISNLKGLILKAPNEAIKSFLQMQLNEAISKAQPAITTMPFNDLKRGICNQGAEFERIHQIYKNYASSTFNSSEGADKVAEMLIFRELARRPKKSNNLETLGLITLIYPNIQKVTTVPDKWSEFSLTINDWRDFLKICMDYFVRAGSSIDLHGKEWRNWLSIQLPNTWLCSAKEEPKIRQRSWPTVKRSNSKSILVSLLAVVTNLDPKTEYGEDIIDAILRKAWDDLTKYDLLQNSAGGYNLKLDSIFFAIPKQLWVCPYTRRFLDVTLNGFSPYTPIQNRTRTKCEKTDAPVFPKEYDLSSDSFMNTARNWILSSDKIKELRQEALWSTYADQVLESAPFYKTAEHSAQQKSKTLAKYEREFKSGDLNILSCSTTMEMGIDIGGIQLVAMNNVPPHPANYLQRAGRAGRRAETKSAAVTLCKANPHDQHVFKNTSWAFGNKFPTPKVSLSSELIIQRHINSYLLGVFLSTYQTDNPLKLTTGEFFIGEEGPWKTFIAKLNKYSKEAPGFEKAIKQLIKNSPYEHKSFDLFLNASAEMIERVRGLWHQEWTALIEEQIRLQASTNDPAVKALEYRKERHKGEYLLRDLANYGFLPGYGFPTSLVTFNNLKVESKLDENSRQREDNRRFRAELPTRDMVTALREYAPGSDLVIDGAVYKSAGITLNWHVPASEQQAKNELQLMKFFWKCNKCGASGVTGALINASKCDQCHEPIEAKYITEYIEPAGFAVDFYDPVTNDITKQKFIKPEVPTLSVIGHWSPLKNPHLGRYRASDSGKMFYQSKGENGTGYALCLTCGRAEPMTKENEFPEKLNPKKEHNRLIAKKDNKRCSGSDNTWSIKPSISFGFETYTDILEFHLKDLNENWLNNTTIANTLSVAMRNALAAQLGIQSSELGAAVQAVKAEDGRHVQAIYIFDENHAGYTTNSEHLLGNLFEKTLDQLNCIRECDSACPSCLLDFEHRHEFDKLNRLEAKTFLTREWLDALVIPREYSYFGDTSEVETKTITEAIFRLGKSSNAISTQLYLGSNSQDADFAISDFRYLAYDLAGLGKKVNIIIQENALSHYHEDDAITLRSLVDHDNINAYVITELPKSNGGNIIAEVSLHGSEHYVWGLANSEALTANALWGKSNTIIKGQIKNGASTNAKLIEKFQLQTPKTIQTDKEILVHHELDGNLDGFGSRFWVLVANSHIEISQQLSTHEIASIEYSDKYIFTPLALALLKEVVIGLREHVGFDHWKSVTLAVQTLEKRNYSENRGLSGLIYSDWLNSQERNQVLEEMFNAVGVKAAVQATNQHSRALTVHFQNQKTITIRLDQGVSYWRIQNRNQYGRTENNYFDFDLDVKDQAKNILKLKDIVVQGSNAPTEIFLKLR
ncbi:MAG: DEAD/DEAH box helicase [Methylotenera sp.]|nr:DEAD/DEAH box helicase [Methylotenera sp.]